MDGSEQEALWRTAMKENIANWLNSINIYYSKRISSSSEFPKR